ncbi:unnamed protein product [Blepharisma stoltei]|uniref:Uncharacterized protein n=1 Tax=Blepharisma stoltei TaxID=1481888 RepID=A0AAU9KLM4_9CILI|nr:unnamed protein product [Blepharisma stoltei]
MGNICRKDPLLLTEPNENRLKITQTYCISVQPNLVKPQKNSRLGVRNISSIECRSIYRDLKFECGLMKHKINDLIGQSKILQASLGEICAKIMNSELEVKVLKEMTQNLTKENIEMNKRLKSKELPINEENLEVLQQKAEKSQYEVKILKCEIEKYKESAKHTEIKLKELKDSADSSIIQTFQDLKSEIDFYESKISETELENLELEKKIDLWNYEINCIGI